MNEVTLKVWIICTVLLTVKMWFNSVVQVHARVKNKAFSVPEDAKAFGALLKAELAPVAQEHPLSQRAAACWRNDLENIPLFIILALGYALIGGEPGWLLLYGSVFLFARVLHTFFYLNQLQPWRTVVYEIGSLATLALLVHDVVLALS